MCTSCQGADSHTSSRSGNESDILMGADDLKTTLSKPLLTENEYREMVNYVETELDIKELIRVGHVTLTLLHVHVVMMYIHT